MLRQLSLTITSCNSWISVNELSSHTWSLQCQVRQVEFESQYIWSSQLVHEWKAVNEPISPSVTSWVVISHIESHVKSDTMVISVDSKFTSYAWSSALALLRWLLCSIKSHQWTFMGKISTLKWFLLNSFGEMCILKDSQ